MLSSDTCHSKISNDGSCDSEDRHQKARIPTCTLGAGQSLDRRGVQRAQRRLTVGILVNKGERNTSSKMVLLKDDLSSVVVAALHLSPDHPET